MSARDHDAAELREEMITSLAAEKNAAARVIVLTGGVGASGIANLLLDALAVATREIDGAAQLARDDPANCQAKTRAQAVVLDKLQI